MPSVARVACSASSSMQAVSLVLPYLTLLTTCWKAMFQPRSMRSFCARNLSGKLTVSVYTTGFSTRSAMGSVHTSLKKSQVLPGPTLSLHWLWDLHSTSAWEFSQMLWRLA